MEIPLSPGLEQFIQQKIRSGEFPSPAAVVECALILMRDSEGEEISGEELNRLIAEGQADLDSGNTVDASEVFDEIRRRSAQLRGKAG